MLILLFLILLTVFAACSAMKADTPDVNTVDETQNAASENTPEETEIQTDNNVEETTGTVVNGTHEETEVPEETEDVYVFRATVTEIGDRELIVAPIDGYPEAGYAKKISVVIYDIVVFQGSKMPEVGDLIEIKYNGIMTEEDPPSPCGVESITLIEEKDSFNIRYELGDAADVFTDTPNKAAAGETVEIRTVILFDTDIHVYVDGQEIGKTHYDSDYWGYSFIMPEKDVTVTARFYTKNEMWGTTGLDESVLREKYPEYYDLSTFKGLEVYVWQMAQNSYSFGVMEGTNRNKELEELMRLKGASADEMRVILSSYGIPNENISVIPWQNPISSYLSDYWIILENEDSDALEERRQEYIENIRKTLFGDTETGFYGSGLRVRVNGNVQNYERYDAGTGSLTPKTLLDTFSEETEIEGIVWEVYSAEEYPDLSYVLVISGTNSSWTYRKTVEPPEDFAFSIVWGCYGISSYDSITGKLVKTNDATDVSKYTCYVQLTEEQMKDVYRILFTDNDIFNYPDIYDPFNAPDAEFIMGSEPNQTIIISVTANGQKKTVTCKGIAFGSLDDCYCEEARAFMTAEKEIVDLIRSLPEWEAFPDYEFYYE